MRAKSKKGRVIVSARKLSLAFFALGGGKLLK